MDRRTFIGSLAGGLLAVPLAARAQKPAIPVIGYLSPTYPEPSWPPVAGFRMGLNAAGYVEGRNVAIEFRSAEDHYDRLSALAAELVSLRIAILVTSGGRVSALAAKAATSTIPIVFMGVADPVSIGLAQSMNRPGGNATGVSILGVELDAKRVELLHEMVPNAAVIAVLVNPDSPAAEFNVREAQEATRALGKQLLVLRARVEKEIDTAFAALVQSRAQALLVTSDAFLSTYDKKIIGLAARHAVPAIYEARGLAFNGGLMSYGPNLFEVYRQAGVYAGKILDGAKPGDLPVLQPTRFDLVINKAVAKALGLTIPRSLMVRAELVE